MVDTAEIAAMIEKIVENIYGELVNYRRDFHKFPEGAWTEFRTSAKAARILREAGFKVKMGREVCDISLAFERPSPKMLAYHAERAVRQGADRELVSQLRDCTALVGILETGRPGPTVALRFDMDCNEIQEAQSYSHRPYREGFSSVNEGLMHACGHDGHVAIGLGVASILGKITSYLHGTVKLIFQPAEEGVSGALPMVEAGIVNDVDYFLSGHIGLSAQKLGEVICGTEGFYATTKFNVRFDGKASHASAAPEKGKNALLAAATAVLNLYSIPAAVKGMSRVNVGFLHAGAGRNLIPAFAEMKIETRGATGTINDEVARRAIQILRSAGEMYGVACTIQKVGNAGTASSDPALVAIIRQCAEKVPEVTRVIEFAALGASEDVTNFMERVQSRKGLASYLMFGTEIVGGHHEPNFDFEERVLSSATKLLVLTTLHLAGQTPKSRRG